MVEKVRRHKETNYGLNAVTEQSEDVVKAGVIDVTRSALQNSASIASLMFITEAMIREASEGLGPKKEDEK